MVFVFLFFSSHAQELSDDEFALIQAAETGRTQDLLKYLEKGVNPNCAGWDGMTPLHYAVQNGHLQSCKALVLNGSNLNQTDIDHRTPLLLAVHFNQLDPAEYLVRKGADVNIPDADGLTPLFYAAAYGDYTMTDMFLFYKGKQTFTDSEGKTPFMVAIWGGFPNVAKILLDYGAEINHKDWKGQTALMLAILNKDSVLTDSLIHWKANLEIENNSGHTALELAIAENFMPSIQSLIAAGANVNHELKNGLRTMDYAISQAASKEIKALLSEAGATFNKKPSLTSFSLGIKSVLATEDLQLGLQAEWLDPRYNYGFRTGISQRPNRLKVLDPVSDSLAYLFRETRTTWAAGIVKLFPLLRFEPDNQLGILVQAQGEASIGGFKASSRKPDFQFYAIPALGFYLQGSMVRMEIGYRFNPSKSYLWSRSSLFLDLQLLL